jgi:hypothetical protein
MVPTRVGVNRPPRDHRQGVPAWSPHAWGEPTRTPLGRRKGESATCTAYGPPSRSRRLRPAAHRRGTETAAARTLDAEPATRGGRIQARLRSLPDGWAKAAASERRSGTRGRVETALGMAEANAAAGTRLIRLARYLQRYRNRMPEFKEMKTWADRLGHSRPHSFTDEQGICGLNRMPGKDRSGRGWLEKVTMSLGSSMAPPAHTPAGC